VNAGKQSFFRKLVAQIFSSPVPVDGSYVFDLHGRWRYQPRRDPRRSARPQRKVAGGAEVVDGGAALIGTCR
jgi:hypothetical protein